MSDTHYTKEETGRNTRNRPLRNRNWCFTINNPDEKDQIILENSLEMECNAFVWQLEEGEEKTEHIQGCLKFENARSFNSVKKLLPRAHIEICKNWNASIRYCQKAEGRLGEPHIKGCEKVKRQKKQMSFKEWLKDFQENGSHRMYAEDIEGLRLMNEHYDQLDEEENMIIWESKHQ